MNALNSNVANNRSTAVGFSAMAFADNRTAGRSTFNTAVGTEALRGSVTPTNNTGVQNTAVGDQAMFNTTSGEKNTAVGKNALISNVTGSDNVCLGAHANVAVDNQSNSTSLGTWSTVNASNKVRIGNTSVTVIEGQVAWTHPSDGRFKLNVQDETVPGISMISRLRPVTYQFDTRKFEEHLMQHLPDSIRRERLTTADYSESSAMVQTGFIAQEVEQVCRDLGYDFSGLHVPASDTDNYGIAYASFVPVLVKAIQEQQATIEALQAKADAYDALSARLEALEARIAQLVAAPEH
jgi:hypothetical protein